MSSSSSSSACCAAGGSNLSRFAGLMATLLPESSSFTGRRSAEASEKDMIRPVWPLRSAWLRPVRRTWSPSLNFASGRAGAAAACGGAGAPTPTCSSGGISSSSSSSAGAGAATPTCSSGGMSSSSSSSSGAAGIASTPFGAGASKGGMESSESSSAALGSGVSSGPASTTLSRLSGLMEMFLPVESNRTASLSLVVFRNGKMVPVCPLRSAFERPFRRTLEPSLKL
mmetsp:Transcript_4549/g.13276  ORF Transcript_4549/g.13276 Transcript_4549/m.13276 type:complete len:227 (-) Transcript_4549:249-929(-)